MYLKAIHSIQRSPTDVVKPGSIVEFEGSDLEYLLRNSAAVPATDEEIAAAGFSLPVGDEPELPFAEPIKVINTIDLGGAGEEGAIIDALRAVKGKPGRKRMEQILVIDERTTAPIVSTDLDL